MGAAGMSRKMEDWEQEKGCVQDLKENRSREGMLRYRWKNRKSYSLQKIHGAVTILTQLSGILIA